MYICRHRQGREREREEAQLVKVKRALETGDGKHSLKAYSHLQCSEAWKRGKKWTDEIGCYAGQPGREAWGGGGRGWFVGSPPQCSQVTVKTRRGRVHTSS